MFQNRSYKLNKMLNDFIAKQQANLGLISPL